MSKAVQRISLIVLFVFINLPITHSQHFLRAAGQDIHNEKGESVLLRGMGLGGWMLQEGYMLQTASFANAQYKIRNEIEKLIGKDRTDEFYEAWLDNHVTKTDIDSLKSWGFNSVRLPMHYNLYTLPIEDEPVRGENTWLDRGFELTDNLINWCKANEMYVILDLHAAPGGQGRDEGISDYDTTKPSLWESEENRNKTVALWRRLAERYADEQWVAGYDLLNETNWEMDNNIPLKELYLELTSAIREVDQRHIIFIEGNWFANDFTNLTPPWDDNLVYSPHKYWSYNNRETIQWVLNLREEHNVPLYFGEAGENSNVWFGDAIRLFEENKIGWAWWPMKKVESISGPLSITKSTRYQNLLDFWEGRASRPSASSATTTLMQLTEDLKIENCRYQKDVIDAMFRQVHSDEAIPYNIQEIPGVVYATDFDMGINGSAYSDSEVADFRVSSGNFTAWNNGWSYRNDGVDIEKGSDVINTNGYNVGWIDKDEWMQYSVNIAESGLYNVEVRVAANESNGAFHFRIGDAAISDVTNVPNSGGWQNWQTVTVRDVYLEKEDKKIRFYADRSGFNLSSFKFIKKANNDQQSISYVSATTENENTIKIAIDKPLDKSSSFNLDDFEVTVNGIKMPIDAIRLDDDNARVLIITLREALSFSDEIKISYTGSSLQSSDGSILENFTDQLAENTLDFVYAIPGRFEAEDYFNQSGIQLENTTDNGGGQNVGFLDVGDFMEYKINIVQAGEYAIDIRTAALSEMGGIKMELIDEEDIATRIGEFVFPATGDWQSWQTSTENVSLPTGQFILRVTITQPLFNINWFSFELLTGILDRDKLVEMNIFPNPTANFVHIEGSLRQASSYTLEIVDMLGQTRIQRQHNSSQTIKHQLDVSALTSGSYIVILKDSSDVIYSESFIKY